MIIEQKLGTMARKWGKTEHKLDFNNMSSWINRNFDIDLWIKLAADNPFKFESQRHQWLEETIELAEDDQKPRLRGILWEINMDLDIARNKFHACRNIARRLVEHLQSFKDILGGNLPFINQYPATVIPFLPRNNHAQTE